MNTQHYLLAIVLLAFPGGRIFAQDKHNDAMAKGKAKYFEAEAEYDHKIRDWFDNEEKRARDRGDRDTVVTLKSKRDAYATSGLVPAELPRLISRTFDSAKNRLKRDYDSVVSSLTRDGLDKRAADAEKELETLLSGQKPYVDLFNGRDLAGWKGDPRFWKAENGSVIGMTPPNGLTNPTYLFTNESYQDFELQCDVKLSATAADSGLMFRSLVVNSNEFLLSGPQCNLGPNMWGDFMIQAVANGPLRGKQLQKADQIAIARLLRPEGFNSLRVRCVGKKVSIKLNDVEIVNDAFSDIPDAGVIGFQLWPKSQTVVEIKNIRLTKL